MAIIRVGSNILFKSGSADLSLTGKEIISIPPETDTDSQ